MPAVPTLSFEIISQTSIVMVISAALRHCIVFLASPAFTLVGYLVALWHDFVQCYYPMSENPGFDLSLRKRRGDEDNPSHDSEILQKQQPPSVQAPGASVPNGGVSVAARRRRRRRRRGVRRRRSIDSGRGDQSTAGRTDNNPNDDNEDNDGKGSNDGGFDAEEDGAMSHYLACPFYKFDTAQHFRCYCKYKLERLPDVRRHILRCHSLKYDDALQSAMEEPHISDTTPLPSLS
jgi:hypothetical protein